MAKSKSSAASTSARDTNAVTKYLNDTRAELRRVTWPTQEETKNLTAIIVAVTLAMAIFLGSLDYLFQVVMAGVISGDFIRMGVAVILFLGGAAAFYFNAQE